MDKKELEKEIYKLKNIMEIEREENEDDLYAKIMRFIDEINSTDDNKDKLKTLIDNLHPKISKLNNLAFRTLVNMAFTKLLLIGKVHNNKVMSEFIIPVLNIEDPEKVWLENMKDMVLKYMLNSGILMLITVPKEEK